MCGLEGHGAFQSYPGGKLKGELKCTKHRNFLSQLGMIRLQHGIDEEGLRALFKLPGYNPAAAPAGANGNGAGGKKGAAAPSAGAKESSSNEKAPPADSKVSVPTVKADPSVASDSASLAAPVSSPKTATAAAMAAPAPASPLLAPAVPVSASMGVPKGSPSNASTNWSLSMDGGSNSQSINLGLNNILSGT